MKRRILALVVALALLALVVPATVFAAETVTVSCTVSSYGVSVTVVDGDVDYGSLPLGGNTTTLDLADTQTVTNNGTVTEDFYIKSSNAIRGGGTDWMLVQGSSPGLNEFSHWWSVDNGFSFTTMHNDYSQFGWDVAVGAWKDLDLLIIMPSTTDDYLEHSITVTIMAVEA